MDFSDIVSQVVGIFTQTTVTPIPVTSPFDGTQLSLVRDTYTEFSTQGNLSINNAWECFVIECPKESYEGSHICIPCGTFYIEKYFSPKHGFEVPLLKEVPGRSDCELHPSNWAINPETKQVFLLGCISPGTSKDPNVVYNSKVAFTALMNKIDWTKPVRITITEE